jgi:hypothetical protein
MNKVASFIGIIAFVFLSQSPGFAGETPENSYCPYVGKNYPITAFWGDTHLHTSTSVDAFAGGNLRIGQEQAYRLARGEEVTASNGMQVKLGRPLDFLVISDHAENLNLFPRLFANDPVLNSTETGKRWLEMLKKDRQQGALSIFMEWGAGSAANKDPVDSKIFQRSVWEETTARADKYNDPGKFTAFIGYEWTSSITGSNLHRNVIFKDDAGKAGKVVPFSRYDSKKPEDLWDYMADYEKTTNGQVLAIPHNGNLSNGLMFAVEDSYGKPLTKEYAQTRSRWEPLYEITQYKGDGEAHPLLSPNDEYADYETWDFGNFAMLEKKSEMLKYEYARSALKLGLQV